ncbi:hypothetical protein [Mucilaginibacter pedocola]|uniref:T9SS C-terminal target domain-containing protein n=1 Tax=Mucilaginibacter pedocola TaxID=1792845 RepID=A0A1S9PDX9_9SPHI|nr:hypothetical protein [Mucilaginibacter pedocola]OOQ59145.1 hypothetical protein BC343_29430 [Mucilaginibacter pedocola]
MKLFSKIFTAVVCAGLLSACTKESNNINVERQIVSGGATGIDTLKGTVTGVVNLSASRTYILKGLVTVKSGATLNIPGGTLIKGFGGAGQKGVLLVAKGGKLNCNGYSSKPVVFTSNEATPANGDWGGIIILGQAPTNKPTTTYIEGVPNSSDTQYGGANVNDNSGSIVFTRIEYAGGVYAGALGNNNEVNGLTLGGVGAGTVLKQIQVSYSGDDSFEFFGGTVNPKYLISYRPIDDDFDFDFGYRGTLQYLLGFRDPEINDQSGSHGIECDNDNTGIATNNPRTRPVISNMTLLGANGVVDSDPHSPQTSATNVAGSFVAGMRFRRNSSFKVRNSIILGWPSALLIDGQVTADSLANDNASFKYNILSNNPITKGYTVTGGVTSFTNESLRTYLSDPNASRNALYTQSSTAALVDPFNLVNVVSSQFNLTAASNARYGARFDGDADFASAASPAAGSALFKSTTIRGAFGATGVSWALETANGGWAKF